VASRSFWVRSGMATRPGTIVLLAAAALSAVLGLSSCTGGQQTEAGEFDVAEATAHAPTPREAIRRIHPSIPVYAGASFREDLTARDRMEITRQFGEPAEIYTLATNDAFPKVWHYYVTYLGQYRGFQPPRALPNEGQSWRTIQINLATAMRDPFIPDPAGDLRQSILLQLSESDGEPHTVIRYIVTGGTVETAQVIAN
jgi:hypothetical protein